MRPYFFKENNSPDKRAIRYREVQRQRSPIDEALPKKRMGKILAMTLLSLAAGLTGGIFGARHELAAWLKADETGLPLYVIKAARDKSIAAAKEKRARRRARNISWWSNDITWQGGTHA